MSVWNYSVQLNDPSNAGGSADATLVYDLQQALGFWTQYILGAGTLTVALNIQSIAQGRESGGWSTATAVGSNGGLTVYEGSGQYEMMTGQHLAGSPSDITINIDPGYFQYLDLEAGLTYYSDVPTNKYNPIEVFLHEVMHGLGMAGYYNQSGSLPGNYESTFDQYIVKTGSGAVFTGPHAEAVYGGPVPITTDSTVGENYGHFGNTVSDNSRGPFNVQDPLTLDLMNGVVFYFDYRYPISALDLAVLQDLGYTLRTTPVVTAHDVSASRHQSFSASSLFSVSAATGDSMTAYQFWDSTADSLSGSWKLGPQSQQAGSAIDVTSAQLSNASFSSGLISDHVWVRAYDGVLWSDWASFYVNVADQTPVVHVGNQTVAHLQSLAASSLFLTTDGDSDPITAYQLWDSTADPASGYWVVDGVAQGAQQAIDVTPAQLANARFQSASGTDHVWARAYDGIAWGDWTSFYITAPSETAPVVTASDHPALHGQNIAATDLFSLTDAESDPITAYQFWDSTADAASGYWIVDGVAQAAQQAINVMPPQLAGVTFQSGSGADHVWVRAYDGALWSDWASFNVIAPVDSAPVVQAVNSVFTVSHGQAIAAASLFNVSDSNRDAITAYQFWDSAGNALGGHWVVAGSAQPIGQAIDVTPAQFSTATFQSGSGLDHLWVRANDGIEWGAWQDVFVSAPIDNAPAVVAANYTPTADQFAAANLFNAVDLDGDPITAYQLWDSMPANGHWVVGGVAQPAGQAIDVTPAQLASATFQGGSGTTDHLWVRANDGTEWGDWTGFFVTTPVDHAPVVTASDYAANRNQMIAASNLFSVSDADNDTIMAYQVWDTTADPLSGHWIVGGVAQAAGAPIDVTPAQLATTSFQTDWGTDQLKVRASDGVLWGDWTTFNVNAPVDHAPVVGGGDATVAFGSSTGLPSLFSVIDSDGDAITMYELKDDNGILGGFPIVNGSPPNFPGQIMQADPSTFNNHSFFIADEPNVTDRLSLRAFDGTVWSDWHAINVTTT